MKIHPRLEIPAFIATKMIEKIGDKVEQEMVDYTNSIPHIRKKERIKIGLNYARLLGFDATHFDGMELRQQFAKRIILVVKHKNLKHAEVAKIAGTCRSKITRILNNNLKDVSLDLLLRLMYAMGIKPKITLD